MVRSRPSGAAVRVDGRTAGRTPLTLRAPDRRFTLTLRRRGYQPWTRRVAEPRADIVMVARLRRTPPGHGRLTVNSIPWAKVYVDGRLIGTTPIRRARVVAGPHTVTLKDGKGRVLRVFEARVNKGHTKVLSYNRSAP
jgi:hypothetical protein